MKRMGSLILFCHLIILVTAGWAFEKYDVKVADLVKHKDLLDDPRPYLIDTHFYKSFMTDEAWEAITYDEEAMKEKWLQVVGFRATEEVGKIAPEIKPGKYTIDDKEQYPFKELMPPMYFNRFDKPHGQEVNHAGKFTEFEIVPTRQYYWNIPIAEATEKNIGKAFQDENGYLPAGSINGFPFPRPSGKHKAMQLIYNHQRGYLRGEDYIYIESTYGVDKKFKNDFISNLDGYILRLGGRAWMPPFGYLDKSASKNAEQWGWTTLIKAPRDFYGNTYFFTAYNDPNKETSLLAYVNILRRIRKLSSSDKQDQAVGQDVTFDDIDAGLSQTLHPQIYPYECSVIDEREFLVPAFSVEGDEYLDSEDGFKLKNLRMERRPMYVVEMKQLDPNYIYSKRILYIDKETFTLMISEMYDQKGRLYRAVLLNPAFMKPMGYIHWGLYTSLDFIDVHSSICLSVSIPAIWLSRDDISVKNATSAK